MTRFPELEKILQSWLDELAKEEEILKLFD